LTGTDRPGSGAGPGPIDREPEGEGRAVADAAVGDEVGAQELRDTVADGEPDAGAAAVERVQADELPEDLLLPGGGDAGPGVGHGDADPVAAVQGAGAGASGHAHGDAAAWRRVLDRVRDQVAEDLTDPGPVAPDRGDRAADLEFERDVPGAGLRAVLGDGLTGDVARVHVLGSDVELAGLGVGGFGQVLDQPERAADRVVSLEVAVELALGQLAEDPLLEERSVAVGRAERILQAVAEAADEAGATLEDALQLLAPSFRFLQELDLADRDGGQLREGPGPVQVVRLEGRPARLAEEDEGADRAGRVGQRNEERGAADAVQEYREREVALGPGKLGDQERIASFEHGRRGGAGQGETGPGPEGTRPGDRDDLELLPFLVQPFERHTVGFGRVQRAVDDPVQHILDGMARIDGLGRSPQRGLALRPALRRLPRALGFPEEAGVVDRERGAEREPGGELEVGGP